MADILMPQLGETVTEGTITRWLKQVGDSVAEDEVLFEVSTDKVDSEVPSPAAGVLSEILVQEGDTVDIGTRLAVISPAGEAPAESNGSAPAAQPEAASAEEAPGEQAPPAEPPAPEPPPAVLQPEPAASTPQPEPQPAMVSADPAAAGEAGAASGPASAAEPGPGAPDAAGGGKVLSPVVRRLIAEHDLDPARISGSGAGGRITRGDVLALIDKQSNGGGASAPAPPAAAPPAPAP
ncbi:MAG: biotin/lipoyl-containing protein, partial [Acidimicrobiales bacterium]